MLDNGNVRLLSFCSFIGFEQTIFSFLFSSFWKKLISFSNFRSFSIYFVRFLTVHPVEKLSFFQIFVEKNLSISKKTTVFFQIFVRSVKSSFERFNCSFLRLCLKRLFFNFSRKMSFVQETMSISSSAC